MRKTTMLFVLFVFCASIFAQEQKKDSWFKNPFAKKPKAESVVLKSDTEKKIEPKSEAKKPEPKPVFPAQEIPDSYFLVSGFSLGKEDLPVSVKNMLAEIVSGKDPQKQQVEIAGITDRSGWSKIAQSQWAKKDTSLAMTRALRVKSYYDGLGWTAKIIKPFTMTNSRGAAVKVTDKIDVYSNTNTVVQKDTVHEKSQTTIIKTDSSVLNQVLKRLDKISSDIKGIDEKIDKRLTMVEKSDSLAHRRITAVENRVKALEIVRANPSVWQFSIGTAYYSAKKIHTFTPTLNLSLYKGDWAVNGCYGYWPGSSTKSGGTIASLTLENRSIPVYPVTGFLFCQQTYEADMWKIISANCLLGVSLEKNVIGANAKFFLGGTYGRTWDYKLRNWNEFGITASLSVSILKGGAR